MQVFKTPTELSAFLGPYRLAGQKIALVPTMGALHEGHRALIEQATQENEVCICSIFVNPIQFNNPEDLAKYPDRLLEDLAMLSAYPKVHVFAPSPEVMYPAPPQITFDFGHLEKTMEGANRPGHFNGVGIVVSKLFHLVGPDRAYFGQKDWQQCLIVQQIVKDLSFPLEIIICPTVREPDGLALSSRNLLLDPAMRREAVHISQTLYDLVEKAGKQAYPPQELQTMGAAQIQKTALELEYLDIVKAETLLPLEEWPETGGVAFCVAAYAGKIRLIDNMIWNL